MVNVVAAGRFKGKRIKVDSEGAFIPFGREHLDITPEIVDHIRMMSIMQNRSFFSGFFRGFLLNGLATLHGYRLFRVHKVIKVNSE